MYYKNAIMNSIYVKRCDIYTFSWILDDFDDKSKGIPFVLYHLEELKCRLPADSCIMLRFRYMTDMNSMRENDEYLMIFLDICRESYILSVLNSIDITPVVL